ncbi:Inner spore coat protein H [Stieleria maiorica]|uniref:Inner spore coat protein H n=1 Tax=Stieleria maiorica TaxID=2795974 RepID=A0A5B9MA10_9BACT|nr:CotH kinase family protein [Stieleria maiorica]QEF96394.1 Inner spore coat protein H [Stieleria maiorica]
MKKLTLTALVITSTGMLVGGLVFSQPPGSFGFGGPGGFGGPPGFGGPGGPGGPNREKRKLVEEHDSDGDGWLNQSERAVARKALESDDRGGFGRRRGPGGGPGFGGPGRRGPGGRGGNMQPGTPGPTVTADSVASYSDKPLYDTGVLRTIFLEFEDKDWEEELEAFKETDVDVPAQMLVDGKRYPNVGVHFRGASSYGHVPRGSKRSFNISMDMADEDQRIDGYKTLNLLNCHGDPSMMSSVLYSHIARQYIPAPKANFVHVVVNGESWGLYNSVQQFDKQFIAENFDGAKGTRWKVSGSPAGDGGLRYLGDDLEDYKARFEMKSDDGKKQWLALIELCKTLNETPLDQLESALEPILDIDGTLKFLALDVVLANSDGYWTRASDYNLFRDKDGKFHVMPHDMNEAFALAGHGPGGPGARGPGGPEGRGPGGPGGPGGERRGGFGGFGFGGFDFGPPPADRPPVADGEPRDQRRRGPEGGGPEGRGPGGRGPGGRGPGGRGPGGRGPGHGSVDLDPLVGLDNDRMPLRSRLLAIPHLRERYLQYVDQIVEESLSWSKLGPVVNDYRDLIDPLVKADTRKLDTYDAFVAATGTDDGGEQMSIHKFAVERSEYLRK